MEETNDADLSKIYKMQTFQMNTFIALIYTKYRRTSLIAYV